MSNGFSHLASADLTDVGRVRKNNEDSVVRLPESGVFCVADGMGGVQGGEVASKATVDALREEFTASPDAPFAVTSSASARLVARAINRASRWIKGRSEERGITGTGSTIVVLVFDRVVPTVAKVLHAGDSRAYRYRADKLQQLSTDHSVAAAAGLPDDKTLPAMFRGVITRAVGLENTVQLEETPIDVAAGDVFLLCSDGLTKMVNDKHLGKLLRKHAGDDLQVVAQTMIDEALHAGGEDNVSVVLVRVADSLPQGPTMEIPPQTRLLEEMSVTSGNAAAPGAKADDSESETGQTVDSAKLDVEGVTPPELMRGPQTPTTPVTPMTNGGFTPPSAPPPDAAEPEAKTQTATQPGLASAPRGVGWVLLAALAALGAAAVWFLVFKK